MKKCYDTITSKFLPKYNWINQTSANERKSRLEYFNFNIKIKKKRLFLVQILKKMVFVIDFILIHYSMKKLMKILIQKWHDNHY